MIKLLCMHKSSVRGFTLIEMMVTVAIIAILSVITLAGYRAGEKRYVLENTAQRLIADLRKGQNMALAPEASEIYSPGIGISFDLNNPYYFFFRDANKDKKFNSDAGDKIIETVQLSTKIQINSIFPGSPTDIFFEPPDPTIYINQQTSASAIITLQPKGADMTKSIKIKTSGFIGPIE